MFQGVLVDPDNKSEKGKQISKEYYYKCINKDCEAWELNLVVENTDSFSQN
jgi:hypothetical protein